MKLDNKTLIGLALIVATVIALFFINKDQQIQLEKEKVAERQKNIVLCLAATQEDYTSNWKTACAARGLPDNCTLPENVATIIGKTRKESEDICFRVYE